MIPEQPVAPPPPPAYRPQDTIGRGILRAILWQLGAIVLSAPLFFTVWGLIQWAGLIPNYIKWRRDGYPIAAKGLLIMGFIGFLLNASCAALILGNLGNMH